MRGLFTLAVLLTSCTALAQEPTASQAELTKLPPYQRMLRGDDAKKVADLYEKIAAAEAAEKAVEAIELRAEVIALRTKVQGADHWEVVNERINWNKLRRLDVSGSRQFKTLVPLNQEAIQLFTKGRYAEAQPLIQQLLDVYLRLLGEDYPDTATTCSNLALNLDAQRKEAEAHAWHQKALDIRRRVLGEGHPETAQSYHNLALNLSAQQKFAEAEGLFQKALDISRRVLGEDHAYTAQCYGSVGAILGGQGKNAEAQPLLQKALEIGRRAQGEEHPYTAQNYYNLAGNLKAQGKYAEAQPLFQKALDIYRQLLGEDNSYTARSYYGAGVNLSAQGKHSEAELLVQKSLDIYRHVLGEDPETARSYNNLANIQNLQGKVAEAHPLLQKALDIRIRVLGENSADTAESYTSIAYNLNFQGKAAEAQALYEKALGIYRRVLGENHSYTALSYNSLAFTLFAQGKAAEAVSYLRQAVFGFEASRLNRAQGVERAFDEVFNPRLLLAAIESIQFPNEAWNQVELSLSRGLLDQQFQAKALLNAQEVSEVETVQADLKDLQSQILVLASNSKRTSDENTELERLLKDSRELSQKLAAIAMVASTRTVAGLDQVQAAIPAQSALLLWVDVNDNSGNVQEHFACVVRRDGEPFWGRLSGGGEQGKWTKDDDQLPNRVRDGLSASRPPSNLPEMIRQLRKQRIEPVLAHLKEHKIEQLFVIGVNRMAGLPVEVLAPEFTISYVPSGTFLARLPKKLTFENTLLAIGDPIYETRKANRIELTTLPSHGLLVQSLAPGGAAEKRGVRGGDVLLNYGDIKIESFDQLRPTIQKAIEAGEKTIAVRVWRLGEDNKAEEKTLQFPVGPLGVILAKDPAPLALASHRKDEAMFASLRGGESWNDLPGTRFEVQRIGQLFATPQVLLDADANEKGIDTLRRADELKKFRYLHFATHGKGNNVTAFESKLILSQDQSKAEPKTGEPWYNNEISAREVLNFWKLNADLVTLSACETGLGKSASGDGLLGFAQAFLIAGARSVCLSLWEVDDTATALLMHRFYQNLLGKRTGLKEPMAKALALNEAKEWLRNLTNKEATEQTAALMNGVSRGGRGEIKITNRIKANAPPDEKPFDHPHFWSAFVLIGEPE